MPKEVVVKASSIERAIEKAAQDLSIGVLDISYDVLQKPGIFSWGSKREYVIKAWKSTFLETILGHSESTSSSQSLSELKEGVENISQQPHKKGEVENFSNKGRVIVKQNGIFIRLDSNVTYTEDMIRNLLEKRGVTANMAAKIPSILAQSPMVFHRIGPFVGNVSGMSPLILDISKDRLQAHITMKTPRHKGGPTPTMEEVLKFLKGQGISDRIEFDNIKFLVEEEVFGTPILVAKGIAPIAAHTQFYEKYYLPERVNSLPKDEHSHIDPKGHISKYRSFKKGELICKASTTTKSQEGVDVFGKSLVAIEDTKVVSILKAGKGVKEVNNGGEFYADMDGFAIEEGNVLKMLSFLPIEGSVGYSTGNIFADGDVLVQGDIQPGFRVHSSGSVLVEGFVQKGSVVANGDLHVTKGIIGSEIHIKGSLTVYYIEISKLYVLGNIFCSQEISNSSIHCSGYVLVHGNKGYVVGGELIVKRGIIAKRIGSRLKGVSLFVGTDPAILGIRRQLQEERSSLIQRIQKEQIHLDGVRRNASRNKNFRETEKDLLDRLEENQVVLEKIEGELLKVEKYLATQKSTGFVTVHGPLFSGVNLMLNGIETFFGEKITGKTIRTIDGRWQVGSVDTIKFEAELLKSNSSKKMKI